MDSNIHLDNKNALLCSINSKCFVFLLPSSHRYFPRLLYCFSSLAIILTSLELTPYYSNWALILKSNSWIFYYYFDIGKYLIFKFIKNIVILYFQYINGGINVTKQLMQVNSTRFDCIYWNTITTFKVSVSYFIYS